MIQKLIEENIELTREDGGTFTFKPVKNNHSGRLLYVTIRREKDPVTGNRLIEKSSSANQVHCVYDAARNESTISFDYAPNDTRDLAEAKYIYDVESINPINATDRVTVKWGYIKLLGDVRNDLNGMDLPATARRTIPIFADMFENGQYIRVEINNQGVKEYKGSFDVFGMLAIDTDGNLTINDNIMLDNNLMIDANGDITFKD